MRTLASMLSCTLCASLLASAAYAQTPQSTRTSASAPADTRTQSVMERADHLYRLGETAYDQGDFDRARRNFDDAVDSVLMAGIDMRSNPAMRTYYVQLVSKVHQRQLLAQ